VIADSLRAQVAEDRARTEERLRKRDDTRRGIDTVNHGLAMCEGCCEPHDHCQCSVDGQDVTPTGQLAGSVTYTVFGWKTNDEDEDGLRRDCPNPLGASAAVRSMLDVGYCQIIVSVVGDDGLVAYPHKPL
jgi:hypothetical protein